MEKGNLSINSENILPIIKKWLYSDSDIFIRELVSNAADAITKLRKLNDMGEAAIPKDEKFEINVVLDAENKIITVSDNGIGMTADEIKKYINEIAFSGAYDFMEKYGEKAEGSKEGEIIGHFGLGFYSAFMVADKVQIDSLSHTEGAEAARWVCDGGIEFEMSDSHRTERGTTITLYIGEDGKDFLDEFKLREILRKYCSFIPVEIYFDKVEDKPETEPDAEIVIPAEGEEAPEVEEAAARHPINDTTPLWLKQPSDCTDDDYKNFYHKLFTDFNEPLFWIHLNMDYPFRLKGILYFPKLKHELESIEGQVKLYNNQVFIADNIKEVIPEFLLLLKGTLDCPDLPLNVSRSFLQNDGYVTKMSGYITKKVADKLNSLFKKDRDTYNKYWDDISPFIKYGCIRENDFYDKVKASLLFKTTSGDYVTLEEFTQRNKEKTDNKVFYVSDDKQQAQYIKMFKDQDLEAVILTTNLDNPFISYLEGQNHDVKFMRIDSDIAGTLKDDGEADTELNEALQGLFEEALGKEKLKVSIDGLKSADVSSVMLLSEQSRRMQEMSRMFGGGLSPDLFQTEETLVLNKNNSLVKLLLEMRGDEAKKESVDLLCAQLYDLAMISHKPLDTDAMTAFIARSNKILEMAVK